MKCPDIYVLRLVTAAIIPFTTTRLYSMAFGVKLKFLAIDSERKKQLQANRCCNKIMDFAFIWSAASNKQNIINHDAGCEFDE